MKRSIGTVEDAAAAKKHQSAAEAEDSRAEKHTIGERMAHLLETGECADIHFLVGNREEEQELISTHKLLLYAASPVFKAQFRHGNSGVLAKKGNNKEKPILVPDVRPDAFRALIAFFYSDDFSTVNKQNVMDVYGAAKKYMVNTLVKKCRESLMNGPNLGVKNVLPVLKHAQHHEDKDLINFCWKFVEKNAKAVLETDEFLLLEQADLCDLFGRDSLDAEELFLFQSLHRWAINKSVITGLEPTPENKRKAIGKAIYQIQVQRINKHNIFADIVPSGLLSEKDIITMLHHHIRVISTVGDRRTSKNGGKVLRVWVVECRELMEELTHAFLKAQIDNSPKGMNGLAREFLEELRLLKESIDQYQSPKAFLEKLSSFLSEHKKAFADEESTRSKSYSAIISMTYQLENKQRPVLAKYNKQMTDEAAEAAKEMGQQMEESTVAGPSTSNSAMNLSGSSTSRKQ